MPRIMQIRILAFVASVTAIGGLLSFTTPAWAPTAVEYRTQVPTPKVYLHPITPERYYHNPKNLIQGGTNPREQFRPPKKPPGWHAG